LSYLRRSGTQARFFAVFQEIVKSKLMACAAKCSPVADFVLSLSRAELEKISGAELFKLIEFAVIHELKLASPESSASQVREAVREWCCASLAEWDILESTPWFYSLDYEGRYVRHHVARLRQQVTLSRRQEAAAAAIEEVQDLTEAELKGFFDD
jgi:hypothetical protein